MGKRAFLPKLPLSYYPYPKLLRTLSRKEVLSGVFPESLLLQISLGSKPEWGQECEGDSWANCLWRVVKEAFGDHTPSSYHPAPRNPTTQSC